MNARGINRIRKSIHLGKVYRFMGMDAIMASLESFTLRYSNPKNFNDPLDVSYRTWNLPSSYERTMRKSSIGFAIELYKRVLKSSDKYKTLKDPDLEKVLRKQLSIPDFIDLKSMYHLGNQLSDPGYDELIEALSKVINIEEYVKAMSTNDFAYRVCCFSKNYKSPKSFLMWSHYADSHKGACFEFDMKKRFADIEAKKVINILSDNPVAYTLPWKVRYVRKIERLDMAQDEDVLNWMLNKSRVWNYEEEVRMFYTPPDDEATDDGKQSTLSFPFEYLTKVIFGCLAEEEHIDKAKKVVAARFPASQLLLEKMVIDPKTFNLTVQKLE